MLQPLEARAGAGQLLLFLRRASQRADIYLVSLAQGCFSLGSDALPFSEVLARSSRFL
jgi:hypothetical protein